ncbi:hypothetical protein [Desulfobotulus mexicanus]|uniref:DUF4276 family protein n=1 Tax=Desulfobotulus mexicanus TaxID=2586642 RepID=A0A5Q4VBK0_9BACT|nr:hypothetical protein [Desulfobotulus mexicanus]TYT75104.1 hypothetical protein FIM25_06850 [Desulfobotulus mexicanus]
MKDLFLYVADADAQAFMKSLLHKPAALGIRQITFDIDRHPQKDSGMVQSGAELARMRKGQYRKALLAWDHHGSGRDHKQPPDVVRSEIQNRLDSFTWKENSSVTIFVPELEEWLWYCEKALLAYWGISANTLEIWLDERANKLGKSIEILKAEQPKELFEYVMRERLKRTISPRDFEEIGRLAGVKGLVACESFRSISSTLKSWFPK